MNYYGYQHQGYNIGGFPPIGMSEPGYGYPQGQYVGVPGPANFGGIVPNVYCQKCGGSGYRIKKNGQTKKCKCIKEQEKRMGKYFGNFSSDSD